MNHSTTETAWGRLDASRDEGERAPRIGIIIPACNEEPCIGPVLEELLSVIDPAKYVVAVGVNGSTDRTAEIARRHGVVVTETPMRGYGFGCQSAIAQLMRENPTVEAFVFYAGDGASDPRDIRALVEAFENGYALVLGARTTVQRNWRTMSVSHVVANFALALWCGLLTRRWFTDLGPHRLIDRELFNAIAPEEMTFGWTIEAQMIAALLKARIIEVPVRERERLGGQQKVSGVNWHRTFSIGCRIVAAGWRTQARFRRLQRESTTALTVELGAPSNPSAS